MADEDDTEADGRYFKDRSAAHQKSKRDWLDEESDRVDARADKWLEGSLRLGLILNAGGVLALLTAAGSILNKGRDLTPIVSAATWFLDGLVIAALGALIAAGFFNYFAYWTHKMYRQTTTSEITRGEEIKKDKAMNRRHSRLQWAVLTFGAVAFIFFVVGVNASLDAIELTATQNKKVQTSTIGTSIQTSKSTMPSLQRHLLQR